MNYCDILSAVGTILDGTHSRQRIHWWVTDEMLNLNQICSDEEPSSSTSPLIKIKCLIWGWNVTGLVSYSSTLYSRFIRNQTHVAFSSSMSLSFPPTDFVPVQARTHHQQTRNPAGADGRLWQRAYHQAAAAQSGERLIGCRRVSRGSDATVYLNLWGPITQSSESSGLPVNSILAIKITGWCSGSGFNADAWLVIYSMLLW